MSFCILGIDFDIQHAYISSYLTKSQFLDPMGALGWALGPLKENLGAPEMQIPLYDVFK